jgi:signal transduction histidine kinase
MTEVAESSTDACDRPPIAVTSSVLDARAQVAELSAALAARDHFIAFVGHELRNALAPALLLIDQFAALVGDPRSSPVLASRASMLTRNLRHFVATINWITEVTDLARGKLRLEPTRLDLVDTVGEVCRALAVEATARGAELVVEAAAPVVGSWDRARLAQLVTNLVANAIRHAGGRIELRVASRGNDAELVVRDRGPGIDPGLLAQLSDPFHSEYGRRGDGIGLWVVMTLVAAMRGSVTANNCADGGVRICVVVPRGG